MGSQQKLKTAPWAVYQLGVATAAVLDTVCHFSALGVVEAIHGTNQVTGNAADAFKAHAFTIQGLFFFRHLISP